jgi:MoxR-like ATPase
MVVEQNLLKITIDFDLDRVIKIPPKDNQCVFETSKLINKLLHFICENVVGREEVVCQSFYAFLTGEHQLILGRTGMAKSLLARQIFECFHNTTVFEKQLTKDTMPDNLFGAYNMEDMKRGKMIHNIKGSIVESDFAFLDEIFDANDMLLRSLLSLLNERKLINGEQIVDSPLNSVIAASNYIRATEILEAVLDRFIYKSYIPENKNLYYQFSIDQIYGKNVGKVRSPEERLNVEDLKVIKRVIKSQIIRIPEYILFLKNYILRQYIDETQKIENGYNFTISDRTTAKVQDLLRTSAVLDGRSVVEEKDLDNLYYLICMVGKEDERARLKGIIDTTKRYFHQDKELLQRIFNIINIFRDIKFSKDPKALVEHKNFIFIVNEIEQAFVEQSIKNRLKKFVNRLGFHSNKIRLAYILDIFQESAVFLKEMATKKETLELIEGFEKDIDTFYEIQVKQT